MHVLTRGFNAGGHTRVVERWIKNAPYYQKHSVVILSPLKNIKLPILQNNILEKNGEFILFNENLNIFEKSSKLRTLGMHYEIIILHTHMNDSIPIVAFGTKEFKRPVLFYNHGAHLFWIGKSICDCLLELIEKDQTSILRRNIKNRFILGIPSEKINFQQLTIIEKNNLRKKLNLPLDKKIIVTAGGENKYAKIGKEHLLPIIHKILNKKTILIVIGIEKNSQIWTRKNIFPMGVIDFSEGFLDYLKIADLYLDSYPMSGGTALIDAINCGVPALSLKSTILQLDYFMKTSGFCLNKKDFISKAKRILNDYTYAQQILKEEQNSLSKHQSPDIWNEKINKLLEIIPKEHSVLDLQNENDIFLIDDLSVQDNVIYDSHFAQNPPFILKRILNKIKRIIKKQKNPRST